MNSGSATKSIDSNVVEQIRQPIYKLWLCKIALAFSDLLSFMLSMLFAGEVVGKQILAAESVSQSHWLAEILIGRWPLFMFGIFWIWFVYRHYTYRKPLLDHARDLARLLVFMAIIDLATLALLRVDFSRQQWLLMWLMALVLLPVMRTLAKVLLRAVGAWEWSSIIVGCGNNAREAYLALTGDKGMGYRVASFFSPDNRCSRSPVSGVPLIVNRKEDYIRGEDNVHYFIAAEYEQSELRDNWVRFLAQKGVRNVVVIPAIRGLPLIGTDISHLFSHEVLMLRLHNNLARVSSRLIKRVLDVLVSSLALVLLSPLMGFLAYKISRDGGSPIYGHLRIGQNGKPFKCLKFRSMVLNSQEVLQDLLASNELARAEWEKDFKLRNDPRITAVGRFIRKTSLDELPQLWNVLIGEMSLVGPRPVIEDELKRYGDEKDYYLMAKPGVTGLWQVSGRNDTDYATRVYLDSWYVKNWSVWYDVSIMFKTVAVVLKRDGAY